MPPMENSVNKFYQNLGKLFYAMVMADKKVVIMETEKLKKDVQKYGLNVYEIEDEFGTDAAYQIEIVFDWLRQEEKESQFYYNEFVDFFKEYPKNSTRKSKHLF